MAIVVHRYVRIADGETWTLSEFVAEVGDFYAAGVSDMSTRAVQLHFLEGSVNSWFVTTTMRVTVDGQTPLDEAALGNPTLFTVLYVPTASSFKACNLKI